MKLMMWFVMLCASARTAKRGFTPRGIAAAVFFPFHCRISRIWLVGSYLRLQNLICMENWRSMIGATVATILLRTEGIVVKKQNTIREINAHAVRGC